MASISVDVEIELDEFGLDDLLDEIEFRYHSRSIARKEIRKEIKDFFNELILGEDAEDEVSKLSLLDKMKYDFLLRNIDRISLNDLENLI